VLRDEARRHDIRIELGARLEHIVETDSGVEARFADGRSVEGDILIGSDGINSRTRTFIDPDAPRPAYAGMIGLGGFARVPGLAPSPDTQHFVFGRRSFFGYMVRADGDILWFANVTHTEPEPAPPAAQRATSGSSC